MAVLIGDAAAGTYEKKNMLAAKNSSIPGTRSCFSVNPFFVTRCYPTIVMRTSFSRPMGSIGIPDICLNSA
jgi:hypothetical protein